MTRELPAKPASYWRFTPAITVCVLLGIAGIALILKHRAHVLDWLPYLVLLACPLMHLFMHRKRGGHAGPGHDGAAGEARRTERTD